MRTVYTVNQPAFSDEPFVGYTFNGSPPRQPRLWFLDRHVDLLVSVEGWTIGEIDVGTWTLSAEWIEVDPHTGAGLLLRYQHHAPEEWKAVWRLTDVTIDHVSTFGRCDDLWRLGLWPD